MKYSVFICALLFAYAFGALNEDSYESVSSSQDFLSVSASKNSRVFSVSSSSSEPLNFFGSTSSIDRQETDSSFLSSSFLSDFWSTSYSSSGADECVCDTVPVQNERVCLWLDDAVRGPRFDSSSETSNSEDDYWRPRVYEGPCDVSCFNQVTSFDSSSSSSFSSFESSSSYYYSSSSSSESSATSSSSSSSSSSTSTSTVFQYAYGADGQSLSSSEKTNTFFAEGGACHFATQYSDECYLCQWTEEDATNCVCITRSADFTDFASWNEPSVATCVVVAKDTTFPEGTGTYLFTFDNDLGNSFINGGTSPQADINVNFGVNGDNVFVAVSGSSMRATSVLQMGNGNDKVFVEDFATIGAVFSSSATIGTSSTYLHVRRFGAVLGGINPPALQANARQGTGLRGDLFYIAGAVYNGIGYEGGELYIGNHAHVSGLVKCHVLAAGECNLHTYAVGTNAILTGVDGNLEEGGDSLPSQQNGVPLVYRFAGKKGFSRIVNEEDIDVVYYSSAYISNPVTSLTNNWDDDEISVFDDASAHIIIHSGAQIGSLTVGVFSTLFADTPAVGTAGGELIVDIRDDVVAYRVELTFGVGIVSFGNNFRTLQHVSDGTSSATFGNPEDVSFYVRAPEEVKRTRIQFGQNVQIHDFYVAGPRVDLIAGCDLSFWAGSLVCAEVTVAQAYVSSTEYPCDVVLHSGAQGSFLGLIGNTTLVLSAAHIETVAQGQSSGDWTTAPLLSAVSFEHYFLCGSDVSTVVADNRIGNALVYVSPTSQIHNAAYGTFLVNVQQTIVFDETNTNVLVDFEFPITFADRVWTLRGEQHITTACCRQGHVQCPIDAEIECDDETNWLAQLTAEIADTP